MFQLLQQLVESVTKQQLKQLMLQVQDYAQDEGLEVKLVKLESDAEYVYSYFTVSRVSSSTR